MVTAELAFGDLGDVRYGKAAREPLAFAACDEQVSDLHHVLGADHLDLAAVTRGVARSANEATGVASIGSGTPLTGMRPIDRAST